jgi:hypothetical protein
MPGREAIFLLTYRRPDQPGRRIASISAHWSSDVIGEYCLGFCWLALFINFYWHLRQPAKRPISAKPQPPMSNRDKMLRVTHGKA